MLILRNGYVIDPETGFEGKRDLFIDNGRISKICEPSVSVGRGFELVNGNTEIDCARYVIAPGLVDPHVHFRDPGFTYKEDIITGAAAAAKGGYSSVIMMGNTNPHMDTPDTISYVLDKGRRTAIHVYACGNITRDMQGKDLTDMQALKAAGAVLYTDDGVPILDESLMKRACKKAAELNMIISLHEENPAFIKQNGINEGEVSKSLGLDGSNRQAEISMVERDIRIAMETGAEITIQHISAAESVELIREARKKTDKIHAEVTPQHFTLTDEALVSKGALARVNPPIRTKQDREALIQGLIDGTIDMIATDHAPHSVEEKSRDITSTPSGMIGLETALSLGIRELVCKNRWTLKELLYKMSTAPASVYGLDAGFIKEGGVADLCIFDPKEEWICSSFVSKASNSPFIGEKMVGAVHYTIAGGKLAYRRF